MGKIRDQGLCFLDNVTYINIYHHFPICNGNQAANLRGFCASVNPRLEGGLPNFMDGIPDFMKKLNIFVSETAISLWQYCSHKVIHCLHCCSTCVAVYVRESRPS